MTYPEIPRSYDQLKPRGKRAVDRHRAGIWKLPVIRVDGRLNVLWIIAERGKVKPDVYRRLKQERVTS